MTDYKLYFLKRHKLCYIQMLLLSSYRWTNNTWNTHKIQLYSYLFQCVLLCICIRIHMKVFIYMYVRIVRIKVIIIWFVVWFHDKKQQHFVLIFLVEVTSVHVTYCSCEREFLWTECFCQVLNSMIFTHTRTCACDKTSDNRYRLIAIPNKLICWK